MTRKVLHFGRPSPALGVALVALFVALGGTGYAVTKLNGRFLVNRSVPAVKVKYNALGGAEINEANLGKVPAARIADALSAPGSAFTPRTTTRLSGGSASACGQFALSCTGSATASCAGSGEISGGGVDAFSDDLYVIESHPSGNAWTVRMGNTNETFSGSFLVYAVCVY